VAEPSKEKPLLKQLLNASTVGIHLVLSTFVGFGMGYFLDRFLGTSPWLTAIFLILGIVAGFRELLRVARRQNGSDKKSN
jgi:ATP synthase protein I